MIKTVGVIGRGNIGSALGQVFADNGWQVEYFDQDPQISTVSSLGKLARSCQFMIIAAPSRANRNIAAALLPHAKDKLIATVAKGVEPGFKTMHEVLEEVSGGQFAHAIMHGPMLAAEIAEQKPATIMLATKHSKWSAEFESSSQIKLIYHDDPYSVALCGVLKNVYAISLGLNDGLKLGNNSKGALTVRIIGELQRLLAALGGDPKLALSVVGIGDLVATGWSDNSFNYRTGKKLASVPDGSTPKGEGVTSIKELRNKITLKNYPIVECLHDILYNNAQPTILRALVS